MSNSMFLKRVYLFNGLEDEELDKIQTIAVVRKFPRQHVIFLENEAAEGLYVVKSGSVKVYLSTEEGKEKILAIFGEGDVFGEMSLLDGGQRSATAQTLEESTLIHMMRKDFLNLIGRHPDLSAKIIRTLSQRLRKANDQIEMMAFWDVRSRIVKVLYDLALEHGILTDKGVKIKLRLTHQDLANLAATSRETVTRILQELHDRGMVKIDGRYILINHIEGRTTPFIRNVII